ncbi:MAG: tetratricopeptide repeat protein [Candidatus Omnitrophica bacterium]|nr:tetratricopeptide repeat protein [Candidatus Omnitrophota bacterium]
MRNIILSILLLFCCNIAILQSIYASDEKEGEMVFIGKKALEDGFYDVALNIFLRFLRTFPESGKVPSVRLHIAQCYFYQGQYIEALSLLEDLLKNSDAEKIRDAVTYWIAEVHFKGADYRQAASNYQAIISRFPRSSYLSDAYYSLGWCLFEEEKFLEARDVFLEMIAKFPEKQLSTDASFKAAQCLYNLRDYQGLKDYLAGHLNSYKDQGIKAAYAHFYLAEAEYYLEDYNAAKERYLDVLKLSNDRYIESVARMGLGWSALKSRDYDSAFRYLSQINMGALSKKEQESAKLLEATLFSELSKHREAIDAYEWLVSNAQSPQLIMEGYFGKADALYNTGDFKAAISVFQDALRRLSDEELEYKSIDRLHYGLAWAYLKDGEFKNAISEFQKVVQGSGDKMVKVAALCQVADTYLDSGRYQKAAESYDKVLEEYAESPYADYAQYQLGVSLLKMLKYGSAETAFLNLIKKFPGSKLVPEAAYSLGLSYFQKGDYTGSVEQFRDFPSRFKDSRLLSQAMYMEATSLYNMGKYEEAIAVFNNIIRQFNSDTGLIQKAEYEIADCLYRMGKEKEAVSKFLVLRSKYPASSLAPEAIWWLGEYYYRRRELELARRYFKTLIDDYPNSPLVADSYYAIACSYEEEGEPGRAIDNFKKVGEFDNHELKAEASLAIADIYLNTGRIKESLEICGQTLAEHENLAAVILPIMAQAHKKSGDLDKAIDLFKQAIGKVPLNQGAGLQFELAGCLEETGDLTGALEEYLKISYLYSQGEPVVVKAMLRAARIFENKGEYVKARAIYEKVADEDVPEAKFAKEKIEEVIK